MKKMFIGNLPPEASEASVREMFSAFGKVRSISVSSDIFTGKCRGLAGRDGRSRSPGRPGRSGWQPSATVIVHCACVLKTRAMHTDADATPAGGLPRRMLARRRLWSGVVGMADRACIAWPATGVVIWPVARLRPAGARAGSPQPGTTTCNHAQQPLDVHQ
jgi:hypothetical protein